MFVLNNRFSLGPVKIPVKPSRDQAETPAGWPSDRPLAVSVSVMLEGWTDDAAPGIGPMGNPLRAGVLDTQARSWADYGATTGAWRLLDILDSVDLKATFYVSGVLAARFPGLMRAIVGEGHVVAAHAWSQHVIPAYQAREEELADLKRCVAALETHSGMRPKGWISPRATPSVNTPELLAQEGLRWYADAFDRDLPYLVDTKQGQITAIPFTVDVNDFPLCIRYGHAPEAYVRILQHILGGWSDIGNPLGCLDLTAHAHVFGRRERLIAFKKALSVAQQCPLAWLTHHARLAEIYAPATAK
jgi:hypothetical protein